MHINFLIYLLIIYIFSSAATDTSVISTPAPTAPTAPTSPTPTPTPTPTPAPAPTPTASISNPAASTSNPAATSIRFEKNYLDYDLDSDEFEARDEIAVSALKPKYKAVQNKSK